MKLLFCEDCQDIIAPYAIKDVPRWCRCKRHAVWWDNPLSGHLVLYDKIERRNAPDSIYHGFPMQGPKAWVIGLHNAVLRESLSAEATKRHIEAADGYLFKTRGSLIIKLRPLESNDTRWAFELPKGYADDTGDQPG
ncbi:MAG: hypothetical protein KGJ13_12795 [Patescibacteria group bacterium]|nr:hypothetical protein [Patescibacteria group bacterium]